MNTKAIIISGAKYKVGDQVILLDAREETVQTNQRYNHFWVSSMDKYIGNVFTIKSVHREDHLHGRGDHFWYKMEMNGNKQLENWGFNEHWLTKLKLLDDELFEI